MRRQLVYLTFLALAVLAVGASSTFAARSDAKVLYLFNGRLLADAGGSPTLFVDVNGGNRAALRKLIGQGDDQRFAVDANTEYIRWTRGVPTVVSESNLVAGDRVTVRVRTDRTASLAQIEATPAGVVTDRGPNPRFANRPLWLFIGTLDTPAANHYLKLHMSNGNLRALRRHPVGGSGPDTPDHAAERARSWHQPSSPRSSPFDRERSPVRPLSHVRA